MNRNKASYESFEMALKTKENVYVIEVHRKLKYAKWVERLFK